MEWPDASLGTQGLSHAEIFLSFLANFSQAPFQPSKTNSIAFSISDRPVCQSQSLMLSKYLLYIELLVQEWKLSGKPQARVWFPLKPLFQLLLPQHLARPSPDLTMQGYQLKPADRAQARFPSAGFLPPVLNNWKS